MQLCRPDPIPYSSPFAMTFESGDPITGALYTFNTTLPDDTDYSYYFDSNDATGLQALTTPIVPSPTAPINAPNIGTAAIDNTAPDAFELVFPAEGETVTLPLTLRWNETSDIDGDGISYTLIICENPEFTGCNPIQVASVQNKTTAFASAEPYGIGLLFLGLVLIKNTHGRKRIGSIIVILSLSTTLLLSCSSGGGDGAGNPALVNEVSQTVTILKPATTYHWKVIADDGKGGITESPTRTFTTQ